MNNMMANRSHCRHQGSFVSGFIGFVIILVLLHDNILHHVLATSTSPLKIKHQPSSITFLGCGSSRIIQRPHLSLTRQHQSQSRCCSCFSTFSPRRFSGVSSSSFSTTTATLFIRRRSI